ncbi:protein of unknown function [Catalinimonas alkaloidigena]|uniref:DUF4834 domain-containing protein n=1 Tax=Catalinimonas alkaloidigena TaxID=1075417 RepID=A0A1G9DNN2_9BACT|nr:DUF4834 family protein [Catalinimonas alkaloidigena]SDK65498.1 protein of unknown function [Catalinimonas alkaloidigena]
MLKTVILFLFFLYMFYVLSGYVVRMVARLTGQRPVDRSQAHTYQRTYTRRGQTPPPPQSRPEGDIRIDYIPDEARQRQKPDSFQGGDYVDYEEVK